MKVLILSAPHSSHTLKIANSLVENGVNIKVFGIGDSRLHAEYHEGIVVEYFNISKKIISSTDGNFKKLTYLLILPKLRKIIQTFKPDIIHAHYASSYGLIAYLTSFKPIIISVWGGDVYDFPKKNFMTKLLLKLVLNSASMILSTSQNMMLEAKFYTKNKIKVIPFGIDLKKFHPTVKNNSDEIIIGIVKPLEKYYGIELLIESFNILSHKFPEINLRLLVVGDGSLRQKIEKMVNEYNLGDKVIFTGYITYSEVEKYHNMMDIGCYPSVEESFGVSIIEASACEIPVVATLVGGIPELVQNNKTGFLVPANDVQSIVVALENLMINKELRIRFGKEGRNFVSQNYNWDRCVEMMMDSYEEIKKLSSIL